VLTAEFLDDELVVRLTNGNALALAQKNMPDVLRRYKGNQLARVSVDPGRLGVWFDDVDEGLTIATIIEHIVGAEWISSRAAQLNGQKSSEAKAAAARANGNAGGRPRKRDVVTIT
jgi:hypothetical protein